MKMQLKKLATVQMGYSFRSRLEASRRDGVAVIQMKDLRDDNTVNCEALVTVDMKTPKKHHLVSAGDLVFRSRGHSTTAAVLLESPDRAVVSAPLLRIRVTKPEKILPEYLNWYISQRDAQLYFKSRQVGTHGGMISKQAIEELEVLLPPLEQQKHIVELASLSAREQTLVKELAKKRERYITTILMRSAKGE